MKAPICAKSFVEITLEKEHTMPTTNIFKTSLLPESSLVITYLPSQKMYKLDYVHADAFASVDVVKSYSGIIASLMMRQPQLSSIATFKNPIDLIKLLDEIKDWVSPEDNNQKTTNESKSFEIPTPYWD